MTHSPTLPVESRTLKLRAFAKINLALDVLGLRDDGYTEISTVFQSIDWHDQITLTLHATAGPIELSVEGAELGAVETNLCWRAAEIFLRNRGLTNRVSIELLKQIPAGGGLGGGSSDAATVLWALAELSGGIEPAQLARWAAQLGADVPYFLELGTVLGEGRGDQLSVWPDLLPCSVVLAALGPPLSTAEVFQRARGALTAHKQTPKISRLLEHLQEASPRLPPVWNDLTMAAVALRPDVHRLLGHLAALGGVSAMSGSGCVVFGLFEDERRAGLAALALRQQEPAAWVRQARTLPRDAARAQRRIGVGD